MLSSAAAVRIAAAAAVRMAAALKSKRGPRRSRGAHLGLATALGLAQHRLDLRLAEWLAPARVVTRAARSWPVRLLMLLAGRGSWRWSWRRW